MLLYNQLTAHSGELLTDYVIVSDPEKHGKDIGELVGAAPAGLANGAALAR